MNPVVSIFKNLAVMLFFLLIYEWKRRTHNTEETEEEEVPKFRFKDLFLATPWYSKTAKIIIYVVAGLLIFVAAFVLFPPTAIYNKIFSKHNLVATPVYEKALNDSLVCLHYENIRYHEAEDTVTFQKDTVYCQLANGTGGECGLQVLQAELRVGTQHFRAQPLACRPFSVLDMGRERCALRQFPAGYPMLGA